MEFLMSFSIEETQKATKIFFHFFNEEFFMSGKELSLALSFHQRCLTDPNALVKDHRYARSVLRSSISNEAVSNKKIV